ncbi:MAG TPA: hypothetical protein VGS18_03260, partial [Thermoplasmata archaeon]|nr:hypothetical protein [Thermoplasmata archaeon]
MSAAAAPVAHPPAVPLRRTPLYGFHMQRQAHLVPFNGWEMPLNYGSILEEYRAVREAVGLFDVGHMGILTVGGVHAPDLLSRRTTADVGRIVPGQCRYTFITEFTGSILDDMLVTRLDAGEGRAVEFLAVPNAGRAGKVTELLMEHRRPDTSIAVHNGAVTILAVQGPGSRHLLETTFGWSLEPLRFYHARFYPASLASSIPRDGILGATFPDPQGAAILVSRTGYTGELGYELFVRGTDAIAVATRLEAGGARACGLAARDHQ